MRYEARKKTDSVFDDAHVRTALSLRDGDVPWRLVDRVNRAVRGASIVEHRMNVLVVRMIFQEEDV